MTGVRIVSAVAALLFGCTSQPQADGGGLPGEDAGTIQPLACDPSGVNGLPFVERQDLPGTRPSLVSATVQRGVWQLEQVQNFGPSPGGSSHRAKFVVRGNYWQLTRETSDAGVYFAAGTIRLEAPRLALTHTCPVDDATEYDYAMSDGGRLLLSVRGSTTVDAYEKVGE